MSETAFVYSVQDVDVVAVLHESKPRDDSPGSDQKGLIIVVGGPQYRVGSHRQFVLLARHVARHGIPALRFDMRGMGDSGGQPPGFEHCMPDIRAAIDTMFDRCPQIDSVALWGLCDGAAAAMMYASSDDRIANLILCNPWVRSEYGQAKVIAKHYYWDRLRDFGAWRDLLSNWKRLGKAIKSVGGVARKIARNRSRIPFNSSETPDTTKMDFVSRMYAGLSDYKGSTLFIISEKDATGQEFVELVDGSRRWKQLASRSGTDWKVLPNADHTFSTEIWRNQVAETTLAAIQGVGLPVR